MAKIQHKALIDFRKMVSNCSQRDSWHPKSRASTFIIVNVPTEVLADIKGTDIGSKSCADFTEGKLVLVLDNALGLCGKSKCVNIYKKTSFTIRLRKLGRLFDINVDVGGNGRFTAYRTNNKVRLAKLAA